MLFLGFVKIWIPGTWTVGQEKRNPQPRHGLETTLTFFELSSGSRGFLRIGTRSEAKKKHKKKKGSSAAGSSSWQFIPFHSLLARSFQGCFSRPREMPMEKMLKKIQRVSKGGQDYKNHRNCIP